ncbi:hypothetical protein AVEN_158172-1 [Araneus ventricosus]|uniref:Uncharacterized protein n=1 Tax=Araneus ventricosus TaxID=182803 RepID=A0A4Y2G5E1_ARAVE|nr:hypothetical protein AVEN_158172-1 [Araneus ventricosus]
MKLLHHQKRGKSNPVDHLIVLVKLLIPGFPVKGNLGEQESKRKHQHHTTSFLHFPKIHPLIRLSDDDNHLPMKLTKLSSRIAVHHQTKNPEKNLLLICDLLDAEKWHGFLGVSYLYFVQVLYHFK